MAASVWQQIGQTLAAEFSDLPDAAQVTRILLRLTLAALAPTMKVSAAITRHLYSHR